MVQDNNDKNLFIGKRCSICILKNNTTLWYSGIIKRYNDQEILFVDKFNNPYTYAADMVRSVEVRGVTE